MFTFLKALENERQKVAELKIEIKEEIESSSRSLEHESSCSSDIKDELECTVYPGIRKDSVTSKKLEVNILLKMCVSIFLVCSFSVCLTNVDHVISKFKFAEAFLDLATPEYRNKTSEDKRIARDEFIERIKVCIFLNVYNFFMSSRAVFFMNKKSLSD